MVFETIAVSDEYSCFISGAAATIDGKTADEAVLKSLREAEYNLLLALRYPDYTPIDIKDISTPADHGKFYYFKENADKLRWLYKGATTEGYLNEGMKVDNLDWFYGENHLRVVTVDLSDKKSDLKVARVFSPDLVPINFGANSVHYTHLSLM